MRELTDYICEYPNVLRDGLCESIIERFEADGRKYRGTVIGDDDLKKSTDLHISMLPEWKDVDEKFYEVISNKFSEYIEYLNKDLGYETYPNFFDEGYQIQKTCVGQSYQWHHDATIDGRFAHLRARLYEYGERVATFILYLNDDFDGGQTQFFNDESCAIIPERGKLIFFPANNMYIHRGDVVTDGAKYIMTGWMYGKFVCEAP